MQFGLKWLGCYEVISDAQPGVCASVEHHRAGGGGPPSNDKLRQRISRTGEKRRKLASG